MTTCKACCWWAPNRKEIKVDREELCLNPKINIVTWGDFGCNQALAGTATEVNVPNHTPKGMSHFRNAEPVDGPVEVLIVTYRKDFEWLSYALRSIAKYLRGFQGVTVAHPRADSKLFNKLPEQYDVRLHAYDEVPGKGMIQHMAMMALADTFLPAQTKYVLHTDADCIFKMPTTPEDYFYDNKPYYLIRSWESLVSDDPKHPGRKVISDCAQWKTPTDMQLGFPSEWYTMCMNTAVMPIDFYAQYRAHIEGVHKTSFFEYMVSGKSTFPQTRMDWTAMGAYAHKFMRDRFRWFNVGTKVYPADRKRAFWSHGGVTDELRPQVEELLRWKDPTPEEEERMAQ